MSVQGQHYLIISLGKKIQGSTHKNHKKVQKKLLCRSKFAFAFVHCQNKKNSSNKCVEKMTSKTRNFEKLGLEKYKYLKKWSKVVQSDSIFEICGKF